MFWLSIAEREKTDTIEMMEQFFDQYNIDIDTDASYIQARMNIEY